MNLLKKLINPPSAKNVSVEITRNCMIAGQPYELGDVVNLTEHTAGEIIGSGAGFDRNNAAAAKAHSENLAALLPPPVTPEPMPESWKPLPDCFAVWWKKNQELQCLHKRAVAIEEKLIERLSAGVYQPENMNLGGGIPNSTLRDAVVAKGFSSFQVGQTPPTETAECQHLEDAMGRAQRALSDWRESSGQNDLIRAKFQCSQFTIETNGKVVRLVKALSKLGLEMFSVRVAALGLGENKTLELFRGSADFSRFVFSEPSLPGLKLAWNDSSGQACYVDATVQNMVSMITKWTAELEFFSDLLATGTKELAKAKKVSQAA